VTTHRIALDGTDARFEQRGDDTLLRAALRAGHGIPYECNAGGCGSCRIQVVDGEVAHLWPDAPGLSDRDRRRGRLLACQTSARSDVTIAVGTSDQYIAGPTPCRHDAELVTIEPVTHDMRRYVLHTDAPADFLPGQYVSVSVPGVTAPRNYSMANLANADGLWELVARRVPGGAATSVLFDSIGVGDRFAIDGPYGLATLRTDVDRDIVCVAGGSGLAPMLSIARGASAAGLLRTHRLHFFYGARTPSDVCGHAELAALPELGGNLTFHPVVSSRADEHGEPWDGATGFVHAAACDALADRLGELEWYCAGPPPMTQALQSELVLERNVPVGQIHFDRFF
jgi:toluene monooxygenase electron transfer component